MFDGEQLFFYDASIPDFYHLLKSGTIGHFLRIDNADRSLYDMSCCDMLDGNVLYDNVLDGNVLSSNVLSSNVLSGNMS